MILINNMKKVAKPSLIKINGNSLNHMSMLCIRILHDSCQKNFTEQQLTEITLCSSIVC